MITKTARERGEPLSRTAWILTAALVLALAAAISLAMPGKAHAESSWSDANVDTFHWNDNWGTQTVVLGHLFVDGRWVHCVDYGTGFIPSSISGSDAVATLGQTVVTKLALANTWAWGNMPSWGYNDNQIYALLQMQTWRYIGELTGSGSNWTNIWMSWDSVGYLSPDQRSSLMSGCDGYVNSNVSKAKGTATLWNSTSAPGSQRLVGDYGLHWIGNLEVWKKAPDGYLAHAPGSTIAGAEYSVYNEGGAWVGGLTTNGDGWAGIWDTLWEGNYRVVETKASWGFGLDTQEHWVWVPAGGVGSVTSWEPPLVGAVSISKTSSDPSISDATAYYTFSGAVYDVYNDAACTTKVQSITLPSSGKNKSGKTLWPGNYWIKETKAPQGYELDPTAYPVTITIQHCYDNTTIEAAHAAVRDVPKTATVRFYVDGDTTPIHIDTDLPLESRYEEDALGYLYATNISRKPNCTPGLDAWYTDKALTQKWTGSTLMGDLDLYARNVATVTYAPTAGSALSDDLPLRKKMEETSPLLNVATDILPPSREANWGGKIALKDPLLKIVYYHDGERWRTLRWVEGGWFKTEAGVGDQISTLPIQQDTTIYGEFSRSTYDGIYSW